jgi:hypothetical protein
LTAFSPALSYSGISINLRFSLHIKKFRVLAWGLGVFNAGFLLKKNTIYDNLLKPCGFSNLNFFKDSGVCEKPVPGSGSRLSIKPGSGFTNI